MRPPKWFFWISVGLTGLMFLSRKALAGDVVEEGVASFYGGSFFQGKLTASGQVFDENLMTAAHRTLKFGTRLRVTDLDNGRSVDVTVNDRGPFAKNSAGQFSRCIDLSSGAAAAIGLDIRKGLARVRLERV